MSPGGSSARFAFAPTSRLARATNVCPFACGPPLTRANKNAPHPKRRLSVPFPRRYTHVTSQIVSSSRNAPLFAGERLEFIVASEVLRTFSVLRRLHRINFRCWRYDAKPQYWRSWWHEGQPSRLRVRSEGGWFCCHQATVGPAIREHLARSLSGCRDSRSPVS